MNRIVYFLVLTIPNSLGGCVMREHTAFEEARAGYAACLEEHPAYPQACEPLKAEADRRYADYEEAAGRAWGRQHRPENPEDPGLPD